MKDRQDREDVNEMKDRQNLNDMKDRKDIQSREDNLSREELKSGENKKNHKEEMEQIIDSIREELLALGRDLFEHPELGFKEFRTRDQAASFLERHGMSVETGLSMTGFRCTLGQGEGPHIALIAELDAIPTPGHRCASTDQGAAHACAHSNQLTIMLGVMKAIHDSGVLAGTGCRVSLIGTPAEEFTDFAFRRSLMEQGLIRHMSGKQDMIRCGVFDDIDLAISCHTMGGVPDRAGDINSSLNGFLSKQITYTGQAAHAGATPHLGVNALQAANIGLMAVNAQRETFREDDMIRVHGIITEGGQTVNSVPERVRLDYYVRGRTLEAMADASRKVNRSFEAGAHAMGAQVLITDTPGYLPLAQCRDLSAVLRGNLTRFIGEDTIIDGQRSFASGDIGDLGTLMPVIQFGFGGFSGNVHGPNFEIADEEMAYLIPAKAVTGTMVDLVMKQGTLARTILEKNPPRLTREQYLADWLGIAADAETASAEADPASAEATQACEEADA